MFGPRSAKHVASSVGKKAGTRGFRDSGARVTTRVISPYAARRQQHFVRSIITVTALGATASAWQWYMGPLARDVRAEEPPQEAEIEFEKTRRRGATKEDTRDIISSQHLQVKKSWENPGVYGWGSNAGRVAAPDSDESFIKTPRRIPYFDGKILRDIKLDKTTGAAIDEQGNLIQWGVGYSPSERTPAITFRGKNLISLALSRDRVLALSSSGDVYSIAVAKSDQESELKPSESSWIPFWSGSSNNIGYRKITPPSLSYSEKVVSITSGVEHALFLTNTGRVFSAAASAQDFPSKGQLGVPGLTWQTRPSGAYDQCHELTTLRGFNITQIAAGDNHSLALDKEGRVFAFGDNSYGQLGMDTSGDISLVDAPSLLPLQRLYAGTSQVPKVTSIHAGGSNSYFTVDATRVAAPTDDIESPLARRSLGRVTADTWACGHGIWGQLGNGRWTHVQGTPTKIPNLSGLFEYDEDRSAVIPIRLADLNVGSSHAAAVMDNVTHVGATQKSSENDTNWGADIVFFGNNEYYQLGTGRRNNVSTPTYIQPLDMVAERKVRGREEHRFQITPKHRVVVDGKKVEFEQRVECGRGVTAVYSGC